MPDLFIPMDTTFYSDFYRDLIRKGILNQFILSYVDNNRDELLAKHPSIIEFKTEFEVSDEFFQKLLDYSENESLMPEDEEVSLSGSQIRNLMRAYVAKDLWGTNEFYQIINEHDPKILKSIQVLENWEKYQVLMEHIKSDELSQIHQENDQNVLKSNRVHEHREIFHLLLAEK